MMFAWTTKNSEYLGKSLGKWLVLLLLLCVLSACGEEEKENAQELPDIPQGDIEIPVFDDKEDPTAFELDPGVLYMRPDQTNFGEVKLDKEVQREIIVGNSGQKTIEISNIRLVGTKQDLRYETTCKEKQKIRSSTTCQVTIYFTPKEHELNVDAEIIITHNGSNSPTFAKIKGTSEEEKIVAPPEPKIIEAKPLPPKVVYVVPPPPSDSLEKALALQQARKEAGLGEALVGGTEGFNPLVLYNEDPHYFYIGDNFNLSSYPVNRERIITNDRYIPAVLENTVNSELDEGRVVGVIENHVYSGDGRKVLLPAGSRAVGNYHSLQPTQSRLDIDWKRIIRPDGVAIKILEPSADVMGRRGLVGDVDRRFWERFGVPLLVSTIGAATEYALTDDQDIPTTTDSEGNITTTTNERDEVVDDYFESVSDISERLIAESGSARPIITVPGGTRFVITPTTDIYFKRPTLIADLASAQEATSEIGYDTLPPALIGTDSSGVRPDNPNKDQTDPAYPPGTSNQAGQN